ncbi:hypothetical protein FORC36_1852 [Vibrio vulnificus]|uniref:hypothetical protein n=1 Tax=Vibrio vulnificus TaxID=672 RepID=UPI000A20A0D9|nr:hypothetical protein [Vibrio vulnificus]ARN66369.1 hypothetical protein FORC36_1852 [Vibrio vulnificus]
MQKGWSHPESNPEMHCFCADMKKGLINQTFKNVAVSERFELSVRKATLSPSPNGDVPYIGQ